MQKTKKFVIITEGGSQKGFGHLTRCIAYYQAAVKKKYRPLLIINGDKSINSLLKGLNYQVFNWIIEKKRLLKCLNLAEMVLIDSYLADINLYQEVAQRVPGTIYLDDTKRLDYPPGVIVNSILDTTELKYRQKENIHYLLGPWYHPIRDIFRKKVKKHISDKVGNVLITLGGTDIRNLIPGILIHLQNRFPELTKYLVITGGFTNVDKILEHADKNVIIVREPTGKKMVQLMQKADIAIASGGQTLFELAITGVPAVVIGIAENQINNINNWSNTGFVKNIGTWEEPDLFEKLQTALHSLQSIEIRKKMISAGRDVIDGLGAYRVIEFAESIK